MKLRVKSGAAAQPRAKNLGRSLLFAAVPVLVIIRITLVGVVVVVRVGIHVGLLSIFGVRN
jgi:hypothetical protein